MSFCFRKFVSVPFLCLLACFGRASDDHLLLCEAVLTPTSEEFLEIVNPTAGAISLDNYFLSDDEDYALLPGLSGDGPAPNIGSSDFIVQFPPGASIAAGEVIVVAFDGAGFLASFGGPADFEIKFTDGATPDMIAITATGSSGLTNGGENAVLFFWDGASDLVQDVDMLNLGTPSGSNDIGSKTGVSVDGPDGDSVASTYNADALTMPLQATDPGFGFSTKRLSFESWTEGAGGNGLTGDDETSELITASWDSVYSAPNPHICGPLSLPVQDIVINEVDVDSTGTDTLEFVELYGAPNLPLDGLVLVLFNGNGDVSYGAFDLDGFSTDADGFFVLGNAAVANVDLAFPDPDNNLQNGADAVALFQADDSDFPDGTVVTTTDLIDALVYDTNDGDDAGLLAVLSPKMVQFNEDGLGEKDSHSNSRIPDGGDGLDTSTYVQQLASPGVSNQSVVPPSIFINEVDSDSTGTDTLEFIELFGDPNESLDGLVLVLFNGTSDLSYAAYDLDGFTLGPAGFFVLGNAAVANVDLAFPDPDNNLQNGADAVALYQADATDFPDDTPVTSVDLIDALVYDTNDADDAELLASLTPTGTQLNEDELGEKDIHSNARVPDGGTLLDTSTFTQQLATPGLSNVAPVGPDVLINEVDADNAGVDTLEFIELFGPANQTLDGLVLVLFNGSSDLSYSAIDLDGFSLDAEGYFVLGNAAVDNVDLFFPDPDNNIQNGADAVALYLADASDFPDDTPVTNTNLIDALVYDTNDNDDSALIDPLTPGQAQINEDGLGDKDLHSNARFPDGGDRRVTTSYRQQLPTPGARNAPVPEVVINEVDADTPGTDTLEFVELYGTPGGSLSGMVLVLFNGNGDQSYNAVDLDGQTLNSEGFFVLGNAGVANVDLVFANATNNLQNGADAVALYTGDAADFPDSTPVTAVNLIDAVVYDTNDDDDSGLLDVLTPGQAQLNEDELGDKDNHSNSRLPDGGPALDTSSYTQQIATPGVSNVPIPVLTLAEIQGNGADSPFNGTTVTALANIVTVVDGNGFFLQAPDGGRDADPTTSEGIYVFTNTSVLVGDLVDITGEIDEYFGLTEFSNNPNVTIISSGNPLPAATVLDSSQTPTTPSEPQWLERFEGMLVTIVDAIAAGPTDQFGATGLVVTGNLTFREPGIRYPGLKGLPVWDGNPELIEVDAGGGATGLDIRRGASVTATGGLTYSFGDYLINATSLSADNGPPGGFNAVPVRDREPGEFTVATQNMFRLFLTEPNYNDRLAKLTLLVLNVLKAPDILAVQEVGTITELTDLAASITAASPSVIYTPYLIEGNDIGGIDSGYLVRNTVLVDNVYQFGAKEMFDFGGNTYVLHDRPPLVLEGRYMGSPPLNGTWDNKAGGGFPITTIALHNRSLLGLDDPGSGDFRRTKRHLQATRISQEIQIMQTGNAAIHLMVLGDLNAFPFTDGYVDVTGQLIGSLDPLGALIPGTDEVNPDLTNLVLTLPAEEQYSFSLGGNAQVLDMALASSALTCAVTGAQFGRAAADFPRQLEDDPGSALRASDHDGLVLFVEAAGITVSPTAGLNTSELGTADSFQVVLDSQPSTDVSMALMSDDLSEGTVSPTTLTFTTLNWEMPQTVTVTGVDDDVVDGDITYHILINPATGDACYAGIDPADVTVINASKDSADIIVAPSSGLTTSEDGSSDTFTLVLTSEPVASVTIPIQSETPAEVSVNHSSVIFTAANWETAQTVTVTGQPDALIDEDAPFTISLGPATSDDPIYNLMAVEDVTGINANIDSSIDFEVQVSVGGAITITGTPNALVGLYRLQPDGSWLFLENVQLDSAGNGEATLLGEPDVNYGVGGSDGSIEPTNTGSVTVPTLSQWGLFAFTLLLLCVALVMNRRRPQTT